MDKYADRAEFKLSQSVLPKPSPPGDLNGSLWPYELLDELSGLNIAIPGIASAYNLTRAITYLTPRHSLTTSQHPIRWDGRSPIAFGGVKQIIEMVLFY
jgi:hypothetical protein